MPPVSGRYVARRKPARLDHPGEHFRAREFTYGFHEILIRLAVSGHHRADARDRLERIELVEPVEPGYVHAGKLEAQEAAADA